MALPKGVSGNPSGRPKDRIWTDAIRMAVKEQTPDGRLKLRAIAETLVENAINGDIQAAREIGDRLDGKAIQQIAGDGDDGALIVKIVRLAAESS
jgi:hypothetical protein